LGLKERKILDMSVAATYEWNYDDRYLWKLRVSGKDAEVSEFIMSSKYKKLKAFGVVIFTTRLSGVVASANTEGLPTIKRQSFEQSLVSRIETKGTARQRMWLSKILADI
jgi:hypothetical protein